MRVSDEELEKTIKVYGFLEETASYPLLDLRDLRKLARDFVGHSDRVAVGAELNCSINSRERHLAANAYAALKAHLEEKP